MYAVLLSLVRAVVSWSSDLENSAHSKQVNTRTAKGRRSFVALSLRFASALRCLTATVGGDGGDCGSGE